MPETSSEAIDNSKKVDSLTHEQMRARRPNVNGRLMLNKESNIFAGVLAGIADFTGANPKAVRIIFVIATILSGGIVAIGYILLWLLLPAQS